MLEETLELLTNPDKKLVTSPRQGQLDMARAVAQVVKDGGVYFIQAPVGTGKTYAYLLPSLLSGKRVVVSTAKKGLQDQISKQDLRALEKASGKEFSFTVLKGANNYYCRSRADDSDRRKLVGRVEAWLTLDPLADGDLNNMPGGRTKECDDICVQECLGEQCTYFQKHCNYVTTLAKAQTSQLVVTNHKFLAHALISAGSLKTSRFGEFDTLILDEGHQFPEALASAARAEVCKSRIQKLYEDYRAAAGALGDGNLMAAWSDLERILRPLSGLVDTEAIAPFVEKLKEVVDGLLHQQKADARAAYDVRELSRGELHASVHFQTQCQRLLEELGGIQNSDHYLPTAETKSAEAENTSKPAELHIVAHHMTPYSRIKDKYAEIHAVVVTSGTLAVGGSFSYIARECGLEPPENPGATSRKLTVETPFNFAKQSLLYTPRHLPLPAMPHEAHRRDWVREVAAEIADLVAASEGNALVLFSAMSDLTEVHQELLKLGVAQPLIVQQRDKARLAEDQYRRTDNAVLLGMKSFFEGFNVVGDKLWLVILPKLPFPSPSNPVEQRKREKLVQYYMNTKNDDARTAGAKAFDRLTVPKMVFDTVQAGGRLIRSSTDRGVFAILDPRLWTGSSSRLPNARDASYKGYGLAAVKSIGMPRTTDNFEDVRDFYDSLRKR